MFFIMLVEHSLSHSGDKNVLGEMTTCPCLTTWTCLQMVVTCRTVSTPSRVPWALLRKNSNLTTESILLGIDLKNAPACKCILKPMGANIDQ